MNDLMIKRAIWDKQIVIGKDDTISRQAAIEAIKCAIWDKQTAKDAIDAVCNIPSTQPEQAIKDCRNCKHGRYNDHWDTYFCYCPNDCNDWDKWEPSTQPSEIQDILNYLDTVLHPIISPEHWNVYSELYDMISTLPSAQPEQPEIIRCKDCKQFRRWIDTNICFCDITESEISDNDFCSRAERRTNG